MSTTVTIPTVGTRGRLLIAGLATTSLFRHRRRAIPQPAILAGGRRDDPEPAHDQRERHRPGDPLADVADLQLGVTITKTTVKAARADAATAMTAVIAALHRAGVADKDLKTSILSLQPQYDYTNGGNPPRLTGYVLNKTQTNLSAFLVDYGSATHVNRTSLDGVTFRVDDETKAEAQARTAAMADAKAKADALASAAGVSITGVASIAETVAPTPYPVMFGATDSAAGAPMKSVPTPVQAGTSEVSVTSR
jgi:uncharacterized protein YggE